MNLGFRAELYDGKATLLDGRVVRDALAGKLKNALENSGKRPSLAIIQVGGREESTAYIKQKKNFGQKIGVEVTHERLAETVSENELISVVKKFNEDDKISGIILQLPIPEGLDKQKIIDAISVTKDADGLTTENKKRFENGDTKAVIPATARGVLSLIRAYGIDVKGKKATVIGRSALVGSPIAVSLAREGADVIVCHRGTADIEGKSRSADILIVAAGKPNLVTKDFVSPGQTVVDVGINSVTGKKLEDEIPKRELVGDVDFEGVKNIVGAISPVPGGVGPMTVVSLFQNLFDLTGIVV